MSQEIKEVVKKTYTDVLDSSRGNSCCGPSSCCGSDLDLEWDISESYESIEGYESDADYALGCGLPTEHANIKEGDTVLDLGSGAGNDVFVARSIVGDTGKVIGVDMTEAMIDRANENKKKLGYNNVDFVLGEIESLPIEENSIDVAVSNCVLNLVPDKNKAYSEVHKVLKPGGHFSMSDVVLKGDLPDGIKQAAELYAGCISGAITKEEYLDIIEKEGFKNVRITKERVIDVPDSLFLRHVSQEELDDFKASDNAVISLGVYAEK